MLQSTSSTPQHIDRNTRTAASLHILVDFESVQPKDLAAIATGNTQVTVFVGANQAKLPFEFACAMQRLGDRGRYVKIGGVGRNAADLHLCFYLGELAASHPNTLFRVVSRDSGFDPLVEHLRNRGLAVERATMLGGDEAAAQFAAHDASGSACADALPGTSES